jgi:hypothetical protein
MFSMIPTIPPVSDEPDDADEKSAAGATSSLVVYSGSCFIVCFLACFLADCVSAMSLFLAYLLSVSIAFARSITASVSALRPALNASLCAFLVFKYSFISASSFWMLEVVCWICFESRLFFASPLSISFFNVSMSNSSNSFLLLLSRRSFSQWAFFLMSAIPSSRKSSSMTTMSCCTPSNCFTAAEAFALPFVWSAVTGFAAPSFFSFFTM